MLFMKYKEYIVTISLFGGIQQQNQTSMPLGVQQDQGSSLGGDYLNSQITFLYITDVMTNFLLLSTPPVVFQKFEEKG